MKMATLVRIFYGGMVFLTSLHSHAQNILSEMDHDARYRYDRMIVLSGGGPSSLHSSVFPYWRSDLVDLANAFSKSEMTAIDAHYIQTTWDQNNEFVDKEKAQPEVIQYSDSNQTFYSIADTTAFRRYRMSKRPLLKTFYRTPAHFYEVDVKDFYLRVNPIISVGLGREAEEGVTTFMNQRGITLRGGIGKSVFFHTSIYDSQVRYPDYVNQFTDQYGVVPGATLYKTYESSLFDFTKGRDFLLATAYVGVNLGKYIGLQLGHNQHFIGDGIRSLFLSDFSPPFFSLRFNTRIWKFHYQNIFAEIAADDFSAANAPGITVPKKYMAAHYLSFRVSDKLTLGLFETVIFDRPGHQFELQYLNPIILYRTVEGSIGSPDNVMIGLSGRLDIKKSMSVYGQFILDDIIFREIFNGHMDWWGNKFGYQLGMKYYNTFGMKHLDTQIEWNQVRPYTYSHYNENGNYSHFKQALAHPLGANFNEVILSARYQISPKLGLQSKIYLVGKGEDGIDSTSFGGDILVPNTLRPDDYGHELGQGQHQDLFYWTSSIQYEISSGLFASLQYVYRNKTGGVLAGDKTKWLQVSVRLNMAAREDVF